MNKSDRLILDEFGEALVAMVRDETCLFLERLVSGKMADKGSKELYRGLQKQSLKPEQFEVVGRLLVVAVDMTIANLLKFLDENEIEVFFRDKNGKAKNIQAISDGLVGELYTEDGWIEKFSKFKEGAAIKRST